ncbi:uncharacterized protein GGS22DRAFT_153365 [Annulohypoxylon maeteangense]|uniref:uncharacterized protein n=1 Tax=Annulohypoxylon maeteangense TaxID=1927788 RepID=UPI002007226B|nr:uncharacterized protein GGS22DRAFT_153365 [Annulohypoxylon maeteangense]KAI0889178.1 hypothetical protein GGS22DRAFT_153365 [Annulohypoxylon maeteangense]
MALTETGQRRFDSIIITSAIAGVAVILRFWCKFQLRSGFHADDWWILFCLIAWYGTMSSLLWGIFAGTGGRDVPEVAADLKTSPSPAKVLALQNFLESLYISVTLSFFVLYTAKISICLLYRRIFSVHKFRLMASILIGIATAWIIATEVANLVHCIPIDSFWHREKGVKCLNFNLIFLTVGIFETIIDATILALPIWAISTIQMRLKTKFFVGGIFCLGGFSIITNILRVYYTYQPGNEFVAVADSEFWTNIHAAVTILCACLPVYKPLRVKGGLLLSKVNTSLIHLVRSYATKQRNSEESQAISNVDIRMEGLGYDKNSNNRSQQSRQGGDSVKDLIVRPMDGVHVVAISHDEFSSDSLHVPSGSIGYERKVDIV